MVMGGREVVRGGVKGLHGWWCFGRLGSRQLGARSWALPRVDVGCTESRDSLLTTKWEFRHAPALALRIR